MKELNRLLPYLRQHKAKIIIGFIFVTISNVCSTYVPRIVGQAIDRISRGGFASGEILTDIGLLLLLTAGSGVFMFLTRQTIIVSSRLIEYSLRRDFLYSIERQPMDFFHKNSTGTLMAYSTNDITAAREFLGPAVMYSANTITTFLFVMYFMLGISPVIALLSLTPLPLIAFTTYKIGRKVHVAFKSVQQQFADLSAHAQETYSGIRVVRSYGRENFEAGIFNKMSREYFNKNMKLALYQSSMMPVIMVLVGSSALILLAVGGYGVIHGTLTLGELTQFFIYLTMLIWPFAAIGWITNIVQRASASAARLGSVFDSAPIIKESDEGRIKEHEFKGNIEFQDVMLKYGENLAPALIGVSFKIQVGGSLGIAGAIGSGKTTIINLLTKLHKHDSGNILIDGKDIRDFDIDLLRNNIAVVPQDPFLFSLSITENLKFGKPDAKESEIIEAAEIACLHEEILAFPDGYDTMLGERGITLSGGQKQRAAIARAVLRKPAVLILDDALSSVDTQTEGDIITKLKEFMKGRTTIIISHRLSTVKPADNIIYLKNGSIIENGSHNELIAIGGKYAELYNRQQLEEEIAMI
ncbi:MAG: ATP-binding cassette, subfamily multidrug efflux pump [Bacteroidota bacterium]|nr:ATP-binding cassette, subfamily multidrug efflux pump [Bacteroidota bacterium]